MSEKPALTVSDLRGINNILKDATLNVTDITENLNKDILDSSFLVKNPVQFFVKGLTGIIYDIVRYSTRIISSGFDISLAQINQNRSLGISLSQKEQLLAILNGVIGDYLEENENNLTAKMEFRTKGKTLQLNADSIKTNLPHVSGKILISIHGLCMNDLLWTHEGHNHALDLAEELELTPIFLKYNTGRHISKNGEEFAGIFIQLIKNWPIQIESIQILTHSMGGLVTRSALENLKEKDFGKLNLIKKVLFLGTPHQGAPLERMGNHIDRLLEFLPFAKHFSKVTKMRSAGITDLRHGLIILEDWKNEAQATENSKTFTPLPDSIQFYSVAGTIGEKDDDLRDLLLGDGLVPLDSALGKHTNPNKSLTFNKENTYISYKTNHLDLLRHPDIYQQLLGWMS